MRSVGSFHFCWDSTKTIQPNNSGNQSNNQLNPITFFDAPFLGCPKWDPSCLHPFKKGTPKKGDTRLINTHYIIHKVYYWGSPHFKAPPHHFPYDPAWSSYLSPPIPSNPGPTDPPRPRHPKRYARYNSRKHPSHAGHVPGVGRLRTLVVVPQKVDGIYGVFFRKWAAVTTKKPYQWINWAEKNKKRPLPMSTFGI